MAKLFTREEAEQALPNIAPLLWELRRVKADNDDARRELAELRSRSQGNGHALDIEIGHCSRRIAETDEVIDSMIGRIQQMGVEVKDIDMGLVDFPSTLDGREVYLCWKLGEEHVEWWHDIDSGYAARQPLD
jgi:hypothetical protein